MSAAAPAGITHRCRSGAGKRFRYGRTGDLMDLSSVRDRCMWDEGR